MDRIDDTAARVALQAALEAGSGLRVALFVTDNTSTMMSIKYDRSRTAARLRVHRMFLSAPPDVVRALAAWVRSPRAEESGAPLNSFIKSNGHRIRGRTGAVRTVTRGEHFDLRAIFEDLNHAHFQGAVTAAITWGRMPETRRRRSIRFGSYFPREDLIRIHPFLDQAFVPLYFVRYIVFHEMLHAFLGIEESPSGRQRIHTAAFKKIEQAYPGYDRAVAWQDNPKNLGKLLSNRGGMKAFLSRLLGGIPEATSGVVYRRRGRSGTRRSFGF